MKTIPIKYIDTTKYKVRIHQEQDDFNGPDTWGNFTLVQFRDDDFDTYQDLDDSEYVTEAGKLTPATLAKLRAGKMFTINYSRYSNSDGGHYRLDGGVPSGVVDSRDINGFIVFEDAYIKGTSYEDRKLYAAQDLAEYTMWANGDVYWVEILTEDGREVDSCGGFIGTEAVKQYIEDTIPGAEYDAIGINDGYCTGSSEYEVSL